MLDNPNAPIYQSGRAVGIEFKSDRNAYPTVKAHALMEYIQEATKTSTTNSTENKPSPVANRLMEHMFDRYFCHGENINSIESLTEMTRQVVEDATASAFGIDDNNNNDDSPFVLDMEKVQQAMVDPKRHDSIRQKDSTFKTKMRVSGVPFYIIDQMDGSQPVGFSGAQPIDMIAELLQEAADV